MSKQFASLVFLWLIATALPVAAYTLADFPFDDPKKEQEFRELTGKLRCLVCQNESLAASDADLAEDLRREVYDMMKAGRSKEEIIKFLVQRYGDFVLYDPPLKPSTYLIWFGPGVLLLIGAFVVIRTLKQKKSAREKTLSAEEQQRVEALLNTASETQGTDK